MQGRINFRIIKTEQKHGNIDLTEVDNSERTRLIAHYQGILAISANNPAAKRQLESLLREETQESTVDI